MHYTSRRALLASEDAKEQQAIENILLERAFTKLIMKYFLAELEHPERELELLIEDFKTAPYFTALEIERITTLRSQIGSKLKAAFGESISSGVIPDKVQSIVDLRILDTFRAASFVQNSSNRRNNWNAKWGFVFVAARNAVIAALRKSQSSRRGGDRIHLSINEQDSLAERNVESLRYSKKDIHKLRRAIERLNEIDQNLIALFYFRTLSYQGISASTGIPVGTVKSRISRARKKLRQLLE
jgi:RNA polymerase sigma factor (sigma-70 family)